MSHHYFFELQTECSIYSESNVFRKEKKTEKENSAVVNAYTKLINSYIYTTKGRDRFH